MNRLLARTARSFNPMAAVFDATEANNAYAELQEKNEEMKKLLIKIVNWNDNFTVDERLDMGSNGQRDYFVQLAFEIIKKDIADNQVK